MFFFFELVPIPFSSFFLFQKKKPAGTVPGICDTLQLPWESKKDDLLHLKINIVGDLAKKLLIEYLPSEEVCMKMATLLRARSIEVCHPSPSNTDKDKHQASLLIIPWSGVHGFVFFFFSTPFFVSFFFLFLILYMYLVFFSPRQGECDKLFEFPKRALEDSPDEDAVPLWLELLRLGFKHRPHQEERFAQIEGVFESWTLLWEVIATFQDDLVGQALDNRADLVAGLAKEFILLRRALIPDEGKKCYLHDLWRHVPEQLRVTGAKCRVGFLVTVV